MHYNYHKIISIPVPPLPEAHPHPATGTASPLPSTWSRESSAWDSSQSVTPSLHTERRVACFVYDTAAQTGQEGRPVNGRDGDKEFEAREIW